MKKTKCKLQTNENVLEPSTWLTTTDVADADADGDVVATTTPRTTLAEIELLELATTTHSTLSISPKVNYFSPRAQTLCAAMHKSSIYFSYMNLYLLLSCTKLPPIYPVQHAQPCPRSPVAQ